MTIQADDRTIRFDDVSFRYARRSREAIAGLSWALPNGRTALLGPNGAGKTTLLRLAATSLAPTTGRITCGPLEPARRRDRAPFRRVVGWMPQEVRPAPGLTAREQVAYVGWLKGMSRSAAWAAAKGVLDTVDLVREADSAAADLSGGQLRRVGLAQALVHGPSILLLDEPSVGLDPLQREGFRRMIQSLPDEMSILVSTHQVDDLDDLFDRVGVLISGRLAWDGDVAGFLANAPAGAMRPAEAAYAALVPAAG